MHDLHQFGRDDGRLFGRFHHDRVAGRDGGGRHSGEDRQREVPRCDHRHHTASPIEVPVLFTRQIEVLRRVELRHLPGVVAAEVDRLADVGVGLGPRLAAFVDLPRGELVALVLQLAGDEFEVLGPKLHFGGRPGGEGAPRAFDRGLGVVVSRGGHLADDLRFVGRIARRDHRPGVNRLPADVDGVGRAQQIGDLIERLLHRVANLLAAEVGDGFVDELGRGRLFLHGLFGGDNGGFHEQVLDLHLFVVAVSQERIVRCVFEQPPDQIGHARHELSERGVDADAMTHLGEGPRLLFGHAVEHLQFEGSVGNLELLGTGQRVRQAAQVVTAECRPQQLIVFEQQFGQTLVAFVRLPLLLEDGRRPVATRGDDRLIVPVGSLHEPDPDGSASFFRPVEQPREVSFRIGQIRLNDDPHIGPVAELLFEQRLLENVERQILVRVLLHIDVQIGVLRAGGSQQRSQPGLNGRRRPLRIGGAKVTDQCRQLDRDVHSRQRSLVIAIDLTVLGPRVDDRSDPLDQVEVLALIRLRLGLADDRLAQQVEREGEVRSSQRGDRREHLVHAGTGDESARHPGGVRARVVGQRPRKNRLRREGLDAEPHHLDRERQVFLHLVKVFLQVPRHVAMRLQPRQDIDEPEHLHLERFVGHRGRHDAVVPPPPLEDRGPAPPEMLPHVCPHTLRFGFDSRLPNRINDRRHRKRSRGACGTP